MLFAKNSDRERNEAQALEFVPAAAHARGAELKLTYIAIPQVARTHACLISRPCWMWGAEMGANEHGVVIGNEAMHAVVSPQEAPALTGMDLLRLALERAATAAEALEVITTLLERHGQGGNCGHLNPFFYHNGFLIADAREAYVLETVGRWWAYERVQGQRALSNAYSIGAGYDGVSRDLSRHAVEQSWLDAGGRFDFAARFLNAELDEASFGRGRCGRGTGLLARAPAHDAATLMRILRDHGPEGETSGWTPEQTRRRSICMHAAEGPRRSQTTGSLVSEWRADGRVLHWTTASAAPCLSVFKPVLMEAPPPADGATPTDRFDAHCRWWRHERLHRLALEDYAASLAAIAAERDAVEARFRSTINGLLDAGAGAASLQRAVAQCWREADDAEARWLARVRTDRRAGADYIASWRMHDQIAEMTYD